MCVKNNSLSMHNISTFLLTVNIGHQYFYVDIQLQNQQKKMKLTSQNSKVVELELGLPVFCQEFLFNVAGGCFLSTFQT